MRNELNEFIHSYNPLYSVSINKIIVVCNGISSLDIGACSSPGVYQLFDSLGILLYYTIIIYYDGASLRLFIIAQDFI